MQFSQNATGMCALFYDKNASLWSAAHYLSLCIPVKSSQRQIRLSVMNSVAYILQTMVCIVYHIIHLYYYLVKLRCNLIAISYLPLWRNLVNIYYDLCLGF